MNGAPHNDLMGHAKMDHAKTDHPKMDYAKMDYAKMDHALMDHALMDHALNLSRRSLGRVWPNPAVGCIISHRTQGIIARGWTADNGRPHAEKRALARAGTAARGARIHVTLEPCSHRGPSSCAAALIQAGIGEAVIAMRDPDPRNHGRGIAALQDAGIHVQEGTRAEQAARLHAGFIHRVKKGRPLVTLKIASSFDGRIAPALNRLRPGHSHPITGLPARRFAHALRARYDAVAVGIGTILADDPRLNIRLSGWRKQRPIRIVFDSRLRLPLTSRILQEAIDHVWILCRADAPAQRRVLLEKKGCVVIPVASEQSHLCLKDALRHLGQRGLTRLLVEGGGILAAGLIERRLVERCAWFHSPTLMGVSAKASIDQALPFHAPVQIRPFITRNFGADQLTIGDILYRR